ncbi:murein biosynthesis integral membrane protein MurJ [Candidatus Woesebacteria bacterium RIFOXYA1_FULL_43_9]|uniref:Probable lipid II flippase MurJ n=1 Tax=Candidatus Woesebacteria bacterium RIFOXYA1_FULL_43_9 TaxID=1802534 RepID=A0A1F8CMF5_9BACT|nr:MAG: murein biosynthesis integral membrane protein MurJ [Candidatus Woesebacteria bacterium RIFOXYA1_FULL_43_9]
MKNFISRGKNLFFAKQGSVLSAALVIMTMIVASRLLGLVRQRTLASLFTADQLSVFFAAFRLPDLVFEILVFGTFSSAFIPVFARLVKKDEKEAWLLSSRVMNVALLAFCILALAFSVLAPDIYRLIAPGYGFAEQLQIVKMARVLFLAQGLFVVSYVLTSVLESLKTFFIPALSPIFYNLGIITSTLLLHQRLGLMAPVVGVLIGAFLHLLIQLPFAVKLGFRFNWSFKINDGVKSVGRLAWPRLVESLFLQLSKMGELYFSSIISTAAYTFYTLGNSLQLLPVGLVGTSIAKAALPTFSEKGEARHEFLDVFWRTFYQMTFLILPMSVAFIVLRIPLVRLVFGTDIFTWAATVQTGYVVSAFSLGMLFQTNNALLSRAFFALHDTKTPVSTSIISLLLIFGLDFLFIRGLGWPVWGLAFAYSLGMFFQFVALLISFKKKIGYQPKVFKWTFVKQAISVASSGSVMFLLIKLFDRSVWVKRLSFIAFLDENIPFEKFVLDTRFTQNLLILTVLVSLIGGVVYLAVSWLLKVRELSSFQKLIKRLLTAR